MVAGFAVWELQWHEDFGQLGKDGGGTGQDLKDRRKNDGEMGEYVVLVKNKFASKNSKEKQTAYATFMTQRRHVFRDRGSMCNECSRDKKFMLALIMRNIATFKHAK